MSKQFWVIKGDDHQPDSGMPPNAEVQSGPFPSLDEAIKELHELAENEEWDDGCQHFRDAIDEMDGDIAQWTADYHIVQTVKVMAIYAVKSKKGFVAQ